MVSAVRGVFRSLGEIDGKGAGGSVFNLDALGLGNANGGIADLEAVLDAGNFSQAQNIRIREGNVLVDGTTLSRAFNLSADHGNIMVTGQVDAHGAVGGRIALQASGSVTLLAGSALNVAGADFDAAGKGGAVSLEAGAWTLNSMTPGGIAERAAAIVDVQVNSRINLSVEKTAGLGL